MTRRPPDHRTPTTTPSERSAENEVALRVAHPDDADAIAKLHATAVGEGFLPTLGVAFLRTLHRRVVRSSGSFAIVAVHDDEIVGVVAATEDVRALYRQFLVRDGVRAGLAALPRLVRVVPHALETLRYPTRHGHLPPAEILVVAVASVVRGEGIGRLLVDQAVAELDVRGAHAARVVTTAGNSVALALYRSTGFAPLDTIEVHRGTESVVLVRAAGDEGVR